MTKYEVTYGDRKFTCPLKAATEAAAFDELVADWEQSVQEGSNAYYVPGSIPTTSIDMTPGQYIAIRRLDN